MDTRKNSGQEAYAFATSASPEMVQRVRAFEWEKTPLGAMEQWPEHLKMAVGICLSSRFPMFIWWGRELITIYNDAYGVILGRRHPGALGRSGPDNWGEIWGVVGPQAEAVMERGEASWNQRVLLMMERNGYLEETYFTWSYSPIADDTGKICGVFCACTEETSHVIAERERDVLFGELEMEKKRLADVFSQSPSLLAVFRGPNLVIESFNERCRMLVGGRDITGISFREALPELSGQGYFELFEKVFATGEPVIAEGQRLALRHGENGPLVEAYIDFTLQPMRDHTGQIVGIIAQGVNVTERLHAHAALRASEERYRSFIRLSSEGIWRFELDEPIPVSLPVEEQITRAYRYAYLAECNDAMARMYGFEFASALIGRRLSEFQDPSDPKNREFIRAFIENGYRLQEAESVETDRIGKTRIFLNSFVGTVEEGKLVRGWGTQRDVTDRRQAEAALRKANEQLEAANAAKDEFLAVLSHELRTPLTPVLLTVSLLESNPRLPEELREDVATIRSNVELESRLIGDLLDLTRIAKGKLQLEREEVDLHLVIRSAIDICQREASAKLIVDMQARRHMVMGDSTRLQQIFWNLINNAQKFTPPEGTITVRSRDLEDGRVRAEVSDTGAGIDATVLTRLFNAFEQGEVRSERQQAGLGLGLAISRRLAEAHGGTIEASSDGRGKGATLTVELPVLDVLVRERTMSRPVRGRAQSRALRVLLVEDHVPTLNVMAKLLRSAGHWVTTATTAAAAIAAARQGDFDVLISDLGLPDGSGLDVMRQLRDQYAGRAIALTGYGMESDVASSREAGFAEHLTKPVDMEGLEEALARVAGP